MSKDWDKINEARAGYITKRNRENEQITTLTEEQHDVIQWLCEVRHDIHTSWGGMFNAESADFDKWELLSGDNSINNRLTEVDLPEIEFGINFDLITSTADWDYILNTDDYEARAEEQNMTGFQLWYEEAYADFCKDMNKVNEAIEKYLADIDKQHGTRYCPSGRQRME